MWRHYYELRNMEKAKKSLGITFDELAEKTNII